MSAAEWRAVLTPKTARERLGFDLQGPLGAVVALRINGIRGAQDEASYRAARASIRALVREGLAEGIIDADEASTLGGMDAELALSKAGGMRNLRLPQDPLPS